MSRVTLLWFLVALQAACCAYFGLDLLGEIVPLPIVPSLAESDAIETLATLALVFSLLFTGNQLHAMIRRQSHLEDQVKLASGAFHDVLESRFSDWSLTPAEREVAVLSIKGFSITEIASLRNTRPGTIKAQCAAVYKKAQVSGRLQLLSVFLDDLMADHLITPQTAQI